MNGLGCILDEPEIVAGDLRDRHLSRLVGDSARYAPARDWRGLLDFVPSQRGEDCVSWRLSTSLFVTAQAHGSRIPRPSVRWLHAISHWIDAPNTPISLGGRSPARHALAAQTHGIVAESRWPYDAGPLDEPPPFDLDVAASGVEVTGWYRAGGPDLTTQLRIALDRGHIPGIPIQVRESLDAYEGGMYEPRGASRGWHDVTLLAYDADQITALLNWGPDVGEGGFIRIPNEVFASPEVATAIVVTAAPTGVR